ncbi:MAG: SdpI family protein [Acidobacteriota bacterium]
MVLVLFGVALGASLALFSSLPERMPIHWNMHGEVNGWAGKTFGSLGLPAAALIFLFFIMAGEWLSPAHFKVSAFRSAFNYLMVICAALMVYIHALALAAALYPQRFYGRWMIGGMFLFFAWLGNMLGKTRRNFWIGIRTPWTLASDAVWIATHRLGARIFMAVGIIGAVGAVLGFPVFVDIGLLGIAALIPVCYSLWLSKKLENEAKPVE